MNSTLFWNSQNHIVFSGVYALEQPWKSCESYSYQKEQRQNSGIFLVLCDEIIVTHKSGEKEAFYFGDLLYLPKKSNYSIEFTRAKPPRNRTLLINFEAFENTKKDDVIFSSKPIRLIENALEFENDFLKITSLFKKSTNKNFEVMSIFYSLMSRISHKAEQLNNSKVFNSVYPAISYINKHINREIKIPFLAQLCTMSETGFRQKFKNATGENPSSYIIRQKIQKAKQMLEAPEITIAAIASQLNFFDCSYFNKSFKKIVRMSPTEYRKSLK